MSEKLSNLPVAEIVDPDGDYIYVVQYINDATPHWESRKITPEELVAGGNPLASVTAKRTSGNITFNSVGTWADVDTGLDLVIAAEAGDIIEYGVSVYLSAITSSMGLDVATIVGGSPVNYFGAAGGGTEFGWAGWLGGSGVAHGSSGAAYYEVQAGDISGGNVTLRLRAVGACTISGSTTIPLEVWALNRSSAGPTGPTGPTGPVDWELVLDEDGTSIANWTSIAGTWSADAGGYIKQTDTTAAYRMLRYTSRVFPGTAFVMQAEVRFPTAATTSRRALLGPLSAGGVSSTHDPWIGIGENSDLIIMQRGDQSLASEALTVNEDQWYTIRVEVLGNYVTLSVDGTRVYSIGVRGNASTEVLAHYASLVNYTGEVHYRNIKAWRLAGPA